MKLFSENLGVVKTDKELKALQQRFSNYSPGYVCQSTADHRQDVRDWMEKLWIQYKPYSDKHFLGEFKKQFNQRSWELYLGATLINRGFKLGKHKDKNPDFDVLDKKGGRICWIEAAAPEKGVNSNKVPETVYGKVTSVPEEEMMLRISNSIEEKFKQYSSKVKSGVVNNREPYVVAINRSGLEHVDTVPPLIIKVLFGIGHLTLRVMVGGVRQKNPKSFWSGRTAISKKNGKDIPMMFFVDPKYSRISAIIYCTDNILNSPRSPREMGENFVIVHNPLAKNPLPNGFFPFGDEYKADKDYLKRIRKQKEYKKA